MTIVAAVEALVLVAVVFLLLRQFRSMEQAWTVERRELLTRIQAPERVPVAPRPDFVMPEPEADEWSQVGMVRIDPDFEG